MYIILILIDVRIFDTHTYIPMLVCVLLHLAVYYQNWWSFLEVVEEATEASQLTLALILAKKLFSLGGGAGEEVE